MRKPHFHNPVLLKWLQVIWKPDLILGLPMIQWWNIKSNAMYRSSSTIDKRFISSKRLDRKVWCKTKTWSHSVLMIFDIVPLRQNLVADSPQQYVFLFRGAWRNQKLQKGFFYQDRLQPGLRDEYFSKMLSVNYKYLTLFLVALAIYLLWMDVSISSENTKYFNIRFLREKTASEMHVALRIS